MTVRARAALLEEPGGPFTVREVELDEPRADEVLVRLTAAGICHTDLSTRAWWPAERMPMVFGHEGAGVVEAVGSAVESVSPGDHVCLSYRSCGACGQCRGGNPAYCAHAAENFAGCRADGSTGLSRGGEPVFGRFFGQSSFATHALAHVSGTVPVPADLDPAVAAPLGCSVQTGAGTVRNVLRPEPGSALVVFGAGSVGLSAVMTAAADGCQVVAVEPVPARRSLAEDLGARAVDPAEDVVAAVRDLTGGGAHCAVDTTGRSEVIGQALRSLRQRGAVALAGVGATAEFDVMTVLTGGLRIRGVVEGDSVPAEFVPELVDLHRRGLLPVDKLITEFPFPAIEDATRAATTAQAIKPVLRF